MSDVRAHVVRLVVAVESSLTKAWEGTLRRPDREALPDQNLQLLSLRFRGLLLPGRTDQGIRNARLSARRGSRPLTSSVNGRRCWCRLRINNGAGRRWRHNCRSGRRLDYPLLLNATRSQRGNAERQDISWRSSLSNCFGDNDEDVPRLHGDGDVHDLAGALWHII